ncbi:MAG: Outer membrane porin F [Formosa sp. Hel3_A1_48]|nr:MAG: Outer membrane porin F [Formosa sp. Hel3_A1_48]
MKKISKLVVVLILASWSLGAQNEANPWQLSVGVNAVNVYPVGEDAPQGSYFDEFFNVSDHWNILPSLSTLTVSKYLKDHMSLGFTASLNRIEKWGQTASNPSVKVSDLMYYAIDGHLKYSLGELLNFSKLEPFVGLGGGYTWIEEGKYNTNTVSKSSALVGAGTLNGTLGLAYWFTDNIGLTYSTTYKHSFKDYLTKHFQHALGLSINFGGEVVEPEIIEEIKPEIIPDTDGDGINDNLDRCPNVKGVASNNGCPPEPVEKDSDNDGLLDSVDDCPKIKGPASNKGCPLPDTDNDGIIDSADKCPKVPGIAANNGCPYEAVKVGDRNTNLNMLSKRILFDTGKHSFKSETYAILTEITQIMKQHPDAQFKLEGHTDSTGASDMNHRLSQSRVNAVRDYLVNNGIPSASLITEAFGETQPTASNATREGRKQNRRVEVIRIR